MSTGINTSNDGAHVGLAKAIYYDQELSVEKYLNVYVKKPDFAVKDGVIYSDRLPGNAFLILPCFWYASLLDSLGIKPANSAHELDIVIASLMPPLFGVLSAFILFWYYLKVLKRSWKLAVSCTLVYAFGTLAMLESTHLFSHAPSLFFVSLSAIIAISDVKWSWTKQLMAISFLLGFSTFIELQNFLYFGPILLYILFKNDLFNIKAVSKFITPVLLSALILLIFVFLLSYYNYLTFDDFTLKSNKYNPFFPEEESFSTALSGNFLEGLDKLYTSFTNIQTHYDPKTARLNNIPGVFVTSPVMLISLVGFVIYKKYSKPEFWLLVSCVFIATTIAALHVTTLVRHMYTINLLMFLPFLFAIEYLFSKMKNNRKNFALVLVGFLVVLSILRVFYSSISYWGRNFDNIFEYFQELLVFFVASFPLFLSITYFLFGRKRVL